MASQRRWIPARRWRLLLIVVACLLLMGFYTATDPERLHEDAVLGIADYAGYAFCHRITSHSFLFAGRQMPLCARCTGMYLGIFFTFAALGLAGRWRWSNLPSLPMLLLLVGFIGIMGIDGLNSYSHFFENAPHLYEPQNWLRLLTGMGTGLAMGVFTFPALAQALWRDQVVDAPVLAWRELGGVLLLLGSAFALVLSNQPALLYVLSFVSAAGVLFIVASLNVILLLVLTRRDARATHWRQAVGPMLLGATLAIVEIAMISFARWQLTGTMTGFPGL